MSILCESLEARRLFALTVTPFNPASSATTLAAALLSPGTDLSITGATLVAATNQSATYSGLDLTSGSNTLEMPDGVLLTSGVASGATPPVHAASGSLSTAGDSQLSALLGGGTHDANTLTVQFTAGASVQSISFDLLFGSDEFPQYVGAFNDGFGAFLDGQQISFDGANNPITVNNNFFAYDNTGGTHYGKTASNFAVGYQGLTTALRTAAPLDPDVATHTLKLVVGDAGDTVVDSGIFLANLRGSGTPLVSPSTGDNQPVPGTLAFAQNATSVDNTGGSVSLTVTRTGGSDGAVSVDFATSNGTALAGTHYTAESGTLSFADGQTSKTIIVPVASVPSAAASTTFSVALSNPAGGASVGAQVAQTVTIANDQSQVALSGASYVATSTQNSVTVTVNRTGNTSVATSVNYATADGTAHAGANYTATSGTLNFTAGETSKTFDVPLVANPGAAASTAFSVALSNPGTATAIGAQSSATVTISNAQSLIELSSIASSASAVAGSVDVVVTRTGNTSAAASVDYTTADGTAQAGRNYTAAAGTLAFAAGETSKTISVATLDAPAASATSTFTLSLSNPTGGATLGGQVVHTVTLHNDRSVVSLAAASFAASAALPTVTLTLTRTGNTSVPATVGYATADGTAVAGVGYSASSGTVGFDAGETSKAIVVPITVSAAMAASSDFSLALSGPGTSTVIGAQSSATVTIVNAQSLVRFASAEYSVDEDAGTVAVSVHRDGNLDAAAAVQYATSDGTALAGTHYTATSGVVSFAAGHQDAVVQIPVLPNVPRGASLTFTLMLSAPQDNAVAGEPRTTTVSVTDVAPPPLAEYTFGGTGDGSSGGGNGAGGSSSTAKQAASVSLTFGEALAVEPNLQQFALFRRVQEQPHGVAQNKQIPIVGLRYDAETHTVNLRPSKDFVGDRFYQVIAALPITQADANTPPDENAPDFTLWFGRGRRLTYIDRDGNRVRLRLTGAGVMQLVRSADGQGDTLAVQGADSTTRLSGKVSRSRFHPARGGATTLTRVIGLAQDAILLPQNIAVAQA